ncbi:MAG: hypothetical protein LCH93_20385 [Proteobacteria bacterium]|nr:hypothetical protein [Pseudomonadota bacterium]
MQRMFWLGAIALSLLGCEQSFSPVVNDPASQIVEMNSRTGVRYVKSRQPASVVAITQIRDEAIEARLGPAFDIKVANLSPSTVQFGPANIAISEGGEQFEVLGRDEALVKIRRQQLMADVAGAMSLALGATGGATSAANGANLQNMAALSTVGGSPDQFSYESSKVFLTPVLIPPREQAAGLIASWGWLVNPPIRISVRVGNDVHVFTFSRLK